MVAWYSPGFSAFLPDRPPNGTRLGPSSDEAAAPTAALRLAATLALDGDRNVGRLGQTKRNAVPRLACCFSDPAAFATRNRSRSIRRSDTTGAQQAPDHERSGEEEEAVAAAVALRHRRARRGDGVQEHVEIVGPVAAGDQVVGRRMEGQDEPSRFRLGVELPSRPPVVAPSRSDTCDVVPPPDRA